ncbi:MAG: helix-turn-helix transcriptional regulator [Actinobacteria bacterium]|nr:MAG: helix-turn-helix transcriptional regulator [Actinomycetota bacterium]
MTVRDSDLTITGVLRLLGAGASGSILMALREGPLRTKELTERVPGYAPRTIYRYAAKLAELGIVEREEEPGVPSKVVHRLTEPCGRELAELVDAYADASLGRLPNGEIGAHEWGSFALVADLWESGMIGALNLGERSLTELSQGDHDLSFHQVSRRASLFSIAGFIDETTEGTRRRRFALTEKARRAMALIAGIGRWRRRHVVPKGTAGLTSGEAAGLIRTLLPLVSLPEHPGKSFELKVSPRGDSGAEEERVWAEVGDGGSVIICPGPKAKIDSVAQGHVAVWVDSILDGPQKDLTARGDARLLDECLRQLHRVLWGQSLDPHGDAATAAAPTR